MHRVVHSTSGDSFDCCPQNHEVVVFYYPTYNIKGYAIVLIVYSGLRVYRTWPINILEYRPVSDVTHINVTLYYWAMVIVVTVGAMHRPVDIFHFCMVGLRTTFIMLENCIKILF